MQLTKAELGPAIRLELSGEVELVDAAELRTGFLDALGAAKLTIVDLTGATNIDLPCIQLLISARRTFARHGVALEISDSDEQIWAHALAATGLALTEGQ